MHLQPVSAVHTVVALLAEGVGRNSLDVGTSDDNQVALLAEGVGRNSSAVVL